ncbi:MAG: aminopeptidase, partial [Duganella sp.]
MRKTFGFMAICFTVSAFAAEPFDDKFRQLDEVLPTPNTYRTASGAPGAAYWQQRADYTIRATLDESKRALTGTEQIRYHNNSPDTLSYLWIQLDQNIYKQDSDARLMLTQPSREAWAKPRSPEESYKFEGLRGVLAGREFDGGFKIANVTAGSQPLKYTINRTMMRIDLPTPLKPGQRYEFQIDWSYNIG